MAIIFCFVTVYLIILEVKILKKSDKYAMFILLQLLNSQICLIYVNYLCLILEPFKAILQTLNSSVFCLFFRLLSFSNAFLLPRNINEQHLFISLNYISPYANAWLQFQTNDDPFSCLID